MVNGLRDLAIRIIVSTDRDAIEWHQYLPRLHRCHPLNQN